MGSHKPKSAELQSVSTPPYCGLPNLSHHLPVDAVVVDVAAWVVDTVVVTFGVVVVVVVDVCAVVACVVEVDVDVAQEPKTSDVTIRQVKTIQNIPLFIYPPLNIDWLKTILFDADFTMGFPWNVNLFRQGRPYNLNAGARQ
jgi:hypothetical protein